MKFIKSALPEVILIQPKVLLDDRGFFLESYKKSLFAENGVTEDFLQDNHSKSSYGVLRGIHYQINPHAQGKLVRCVTGSIFDIAVDLRRNSPNFGKWVGYELSADNKQMLYIPAGFGHGFLTLANDTNILYKATNEYSAVSDRGIIFNDPQISVEWPKINIEYIISEKDVKQPLLKDAELNF